MFCFISIFFVGFVYIGSHNKVVSSYLWEILRSFDGNRATKFNEILNLILWRVNNFRFDNAVKLKWGLSVDFLEFFAWLICQRQTIDQISKLTFEWLILIEIFDFDREFLVEFRFWLWSQWFCIELAFLHDWTPAIHSLTHSPRAPPF